MTAAHLAQVLLSEKWLDDEVIDCLGDVFHMELVAQVSGEDTIGNAPRTLVATAHLCTCLSNEQSSISRYYEEKLVSGSATRLLMLCNINNVHWIPVEVNTTQETISLGDSKPKLSQAHIPSLLHDVRAWLDRIIPGRTWTVRMTALETGLQQDALSCSIAAVNALKRCIFPTATKWSPHAPGKARARYFCRCLQAGLRSTVCGTFINRHRNFDARILILQFCRRVQVNLQGQGRVCCSTLSLQRRTPSSPHQVRETQSARMVQAQRCSAAVDACYSRPHQRRCCPLRMRMMMTTMRAHWNLTTLMTTAQMVPHGLAKLGHCGPGSP